MTLVRHYLAGWHDGWNGHDAARGDTGYLAGHHAGLAARARKQVVDAERGAKVYDRGFRNVGQHDCGYAEREA